MFEWRSDTDLDVDGVRFALAPTNPAPGRKAARETGALVLRKARWMVERYADLADAIQPDNVVELGIYDGGSTALLSLLFHPKRLVALDLRANRVPELDAFVGARDLGASVRAHFGVDQSDRPTVEGIIDSEFGGEPLDLVIDDASHLLDETTASFNLLFPRLRPGGLFVIEDWSWQHARDAGLANALLTDETLRADVERRLATGEIASPGPDAMSRLVLELVLTAAYDETIVAEVTSVRASWTVVRRGTAELDRDSFDIRQAYGALGRAQLRDRAPGPS